MTLRPSPHRVIRRTVFALCGAVIATAVVAAGQTSVRQGQQPIFRGGVDVVQIDVSVLDDKRKPVRGLTAEDFEVFENGKPQAISAVAEFAMDDVPFVQPVWARAAPPDVSSNVADGRRMFAIVYDLRNSFVKRLGITDLRIPSIESVESAQHVGYQILERVGPDDLVAVMGNGVFQPFTNDLDKLYTAIDELNPEVRRSKTTKPGGPRGLTSLPGLDTLWDVAEYLAAIPERRKAIIYVSQGQPVPTAANYLLQMVLWHAQRANVNIYTINPYALGPTKSASARLDSLMILARNTGGEAITNPLDLQRGLDQMFVENGSFYIVGYRTANPAMDGKFRRLEVKVKERKGLTVRARNQIYRPKVEKPDDTTAAKPSDNLFAGRSGLLPNLDVGFDVAAMPFAQPGRRDASVPIVVALTEPVQPGATRIKQYLNLRILAYDDTGAVRSDVRLPVSLDVEASTTERFRYEVITRLDLTPGRYNFRVVAQNPATDKTGAIEFDLTVPDFRREAVSISGLSATAGSIAPLQGAESVTAVLPSVPSALRVFRSSERVSVFGRVYEGGTEPLQTVSLEGQLLDASGTAIRTIAETLTPDRFDADRAFDWRFDLPLTDLPAGPYLLTLQATLGSHRSAKRDLRFTVR